MVDIRCEPFAPARDEDQKMSDDDKPVLTLRLTDRDLSGPYLLGGSLSVLLGNVCYQRWGNGSKQAYATVVATMVAHMLTFEEPAQDPNTFQRLVDTFNEQLVQQWQHMEWFCRKSSPETTAVNGRRQLVR
jgi:hypothetical protein